MRIAKHCGKAFIRIAQPSGLPSPFDLTGDLRWNVDGELFERYDLAIKEEEGADSSDGELTHSLNTSDDGYPVDNIKESLEKQEGVKVLNQNSEICEQKAIKENDEEIMGTLDGETRNLLDEFTRIFTFERE